MEKTTFTISLEDHFFPHVQITANANYKPSATDIEVKINSDIKAVQTKDDRDRYMTELRVKLDGDTGESIPYHFDVVGICFITIRGDHATEDKKKAVLQSAHLILYPAIRELILTITARQPWGKFSIGLGTLQEKKEKNALLARDKKSQAEQKKKRAPRKTIAESNS